MEARAIKIYNDVLVARSTDAEGLKYTLYLEMSCEFRAIKVVSTSHACARDTLMDDLNVLLSFFSVRCDDQNNISVLPPAK